jgi:hypothetical protein
MQPSTTEVMIAWSHFVSLTNEAFAFSPSNFPSVKSPAAFREQSVLQHFPCPLAEVLHVSWHCLCIILCEWNLGKFGQHSDIFVPFGGFSHPGGGGRLRVSFFGDPSFWLSFLPSLDPDF